MDRRTADTLGDRALTDCLLERSPAVAAFTLYMWNAERSAFIARALKDRDPGMVTVAGGPEVTSDNTWLRDCGAFDLLVSGEGEEVAPEALDPAHARSLIRRSGGFLKTGSGTFVPGSLPDPWLSGYLDPAESASVMVETVRGCSGGCTYCSYRRSHPLPRMMTAEAAAGLVERLTSAGAREIVFIDPTFNSRPDLHQLLRGLASQKGPDLFAEIRGDLVTPGQASMMADAGFRTVEVGLQSCDIATLERAGRPCNPEKVMDGAAALRNAGVTPLMDIILGLEGDTPENAVRTALMLRDRGLHRDVQVFHLSVLPGTDLRMRLGRGYMQLPPYYRFTAGDMNGFADAREEIADILGYDLELRTRPLLFEGWPGTEVVRTNSGAHSGSIPPSFRHGALRIISEDPWTDGAEVLELVRRRREADPFCVLDVILVPEREFPLDLVSMLRSIEEPRDCAGRTAEVLGMEGNLRLSILLGEMAAFSAGWTEAAAGCCDVAVDVREPEELEARLWEAGVFVRLRGKLWKMPDLAERVPSIHQVLFGEREMEEAWARYMDL